LTPKITSITPDQVRKLCQLAKIKLSPEEEMSFSKDLSKILDYFSQIDKVIVSGFNTEPDPKESVYTNSLREDEPVQCPSDDILKSVPVKKGRFVRGPKMS